MESDKVIMNYIRRQSFPDYTFSKFTDWFGLFFKAGRASVYSDEQRAIVLSKYEAYEDTKDQDLFETHMKIFDLDPLDPYYNISPEEEKGEICYKSFPRPYMIGEICGEKTQIQMENQGIMVTVVEIDTTWDWIQPSGNMKNEELQDFAYRNNTRVTQLGSQVRFENKGPTDEERARNE